ncbi:MAG: ribonuclease E inhibitor RraB [Sulfurimonas sp.]
MRENFVRVEDDTKIVIEHEPTAFGYSKKYSWLFSLFIKFDGLNEDADGYEEFLETKEALIIALEHEEKAKYVGSRMLDGWSELYFYAEDSKGLDTIVTHILKDAGYLYESSVVRDGKWDFHYKNLLPNELELAHIQTQDILELLKEEGDNLEHKREIEYYLSFETPTQKERYIEEFIPKEFTFKDEISSDEFANGIALTKEDAPSQEILEENVQKLHESVKKVHGYYEGWSTTLADNKES